MNELSQVPTNQSKATSYDTKSRHVLVAASEAALQCMRQVLQASDQYTLIEADTVADAERIITAKDIYLFVIGVHLDESRSVELVNLIRSTSKTEKTPILIVRVTPSEIPEIVRQTMNMLKNLGIINDFLELENSPDAAERIARAVNQYIS